MVRLQHNYYLFRSHSFMSVNVGKNDKLMTQTSRKSVV